MGKQYGMDGKPKEDWSRKMDNKKNEMISNEINHSWANIMAWKAI